MAYGTPSDPSEVEPYFTHIRGGRTPSAESVARLRRRYELVGGRTPLLEITKALAEGVERQLAAGGAAIRVYVGMKHWHPFIGDVVPRMVQDGVTDITAIALAPHYSRISIGGYQKAVDTAVAAVPAAATIGVTHVDSWHLHPRFIKLVASRITDAMAVAPRGAAGQTVTVFSAHSLPSRIREWNDPYEAQLLASCHAVAQAVGIDHWRFAWQSAGDTGEPWLGPDICDVVRTLHREGVRHVLSVPIGFVADHLEIFYDIDHEARGVASELGMQLWRTAMPNADPRFAELLAAIVAEAAIESHRACAS
jgi:protoporphyrin/coproporphyrin ferrochelatase